MAVANRGLRLDGEQEGRDEAVDIVNTRRPVGILQMVQVPPQEEKKTGGKWREGDKDGHLVFEWRGLGLVRVKGEG